MTIHIFARLAWHDSGWNGKIREKGDGFIFASPHSIGRSKTAPLTSVVGLK